MSLPAMLLARVRAWGTNQLHSRALGGYALGERVRSCGNVRGDRMPVIIPAPMPGLDLRREYGHHQSPAIQAGGLIFCSEMLAITPQTGEGEHGTVTSEPRRIFENLKLLLEPAGSSLERLVQVHAM